MSRYPAHDHLSVWYLGEPEQPRRVGALRFVPRQGIGAVFEYDPQWVAKGFALSADLPLVAEHAFHVQPPGTERAPGALDDARPDRWGERVIRHLFRPERLSVMEFLHYAGDQWFGALGVSAADDRYEPFERAALPSFADVDALHAAVRNIMRGEPVPEEQRRLIRAGSTLGGARPKALLTDEAGREWVLKFPREDRLWEPDVEHASLQLARLAGIRVVNSHMVRHHAGAALAIERFDREESGLRRHVLSAAVVLRAAGREESYPDLALELRRQGDPQTFASDMVELYRRMIFNMLIDNTDDHERNHALFSDRLGRLRLTPAYDVLPTCHGLKCQALILGDQGADVSLENALSRARDFGLKQPAAKGIIAEVAAVVDQWYEVFTEHGVSEDQVAAVVDWINGEYLQGLRETAARWR